MLSHTAISGIPKVGIYSQTLVLGDFFFVLSLYGEGVNLELGRNTLSKIEEIVSQTPTISPNELVEMQKEEYVNGIKLNILVAKIDGQRLSLAGFGDVLAKLTRDGKIVNLFSAAPISGHLLHDDSLVLGTKQSESVNFDAPTSDDPHVGAIQIKISLQENQPTVFLRPLRNLNAPAKFSRKLLYLILIILIFLISTIAFQLRSKVLEQREKASQNLERQVNDGLNSAQKLAGLNDAIAHDVLLQTRQDFISQAQQSFSNNLPPKLQKLLAKLDKEISLTSRLYNLSSLDLFYDFSLLKSGAQISSAVLHKGEVVALDSKNGTTLSLNLNTKGTTLIIGSNDLKNSQYIDFSGNQIYTWGPNGIFSIDRSTSLATIKNIIPASPKWGSVKDVKVFVGNIYLLDSQNNQIWKYQNTDLGFGEITNYLNRGTLLDFSNVFAMAIDGSINVLTTTGNLAKFSSGSSEPFKIAGLDPAFKNPVSFFTSDDVANIYILDNGGKRVVVLNKKGAYVGQYLLPDPKNIILADENLKKVFLISGSKVYSFNLQ